MRAPLLLAFAASLSALLASACAPTKFPRETRAANARNGDRFLEGERCPTGGVDDAQLRAEDLEVGSGAAVAPGETVRVHYAARLPSGELVRSSRDSGLPVELIVGAGKTMCGFDRALVGMRPGGQRKVVVPARLAFGETGHAPEVPPDTDLAFVIDLYLPADTGREPHSAPVNPAGARRR